MARIRSVKPELFLHEGLFDLEKATGLPIIRCWIALFTQADREGRMEWRPRALKAQCAPYDDFDFALVLDALAAAGFIVRYAVDRKEYALIPSFLDHQCPNQREPASKLPEPTPEAIDAARDTTRCERCTMRAYACTCKHIPARVEGNGNGMEGNGNGFGAGEPRKPDPTPEEGGLFPEPGPEPEEAPQKVRAEDIPIPPELDCDEFRETWFAWIADRRARRKSIRPDFLERKLKTFLKHGVKASAASMQEALEQGYDGCWPENFDRNGFKKKGAKHDTSNRTGPGQRYAGAGTGGDYREPAASGGHGPEAGVGVGSQGSGSVVAGRWRPGD